MNFVSKIIGVILFTLFFGFALKNDQIVTLQYFWGYAQSAPLVIWLFGFFSLGVVLAVLAMVPMVFRENAPLGINVQVTSRARQQGSDCTDWTSSSSVGWV